VDISLSVVTRPSSCVSVFNLPMLLFFYNDICDGIRAFPLKNLYHICHIR
jgi:hypothetical protein